MGKKFDRMITETYDDPEVAAAVAEHCKMNNTVTKIESGERVLPHPADAKRWYDAMKADETKKRAEEAQRTESGVSPADTDEATAR